jgi:hypothetical protein
LAVAAIIDVGATRVPASRRLRRSRLGGHSFRVRVKLDGVDSDTTPSRKGR